jgi:hypothetical protein
MTNAMTTIRINDADGQEVTRIETRDPAFSFEQYCRNRDSAGWSFAAGAAQVQAGLPGSTEAIFEPVTEPVPHS